MPNIDAKLTFGLELECTKLTTAAPEIMARQGFSLHYDRSIKADDGSDLPRTIEEGGGAEIITSPMTVGVRCGQDGRNLHLDFGNTPEIVQDLCRAVARVNSSCGLHIHLGRPTKDAISNSSWEPDRVRAFLLIGKMLEDKLFDVCPRSRRGNPYCKKIGESYSQLELAEYYPMGTVLPNKYRNPKRYCWLNLIETRREHERSPHTVEVRMLGHVRRYDYIWSWVQLWCRIAAYVAYLPATLAFSRCCLSSDLEAAFLQVSRAQLNRATQSLDELTVSPTVSAVEDSLEVPVVPGDLHAEAARLATSPEDWAPRR